MTRLGRTTVFGILLMVSLSTLTGCAGYFRDPPEYQDEDKKPVLFSIATRQFPPDPVYNRVTWVRPPQVTPNRRIEASEAPVIMPIINFEVENESLKDAVLVLAAAAQYRAYCSSVIADRRITMNTLGTMEEIAHAIEKQSGISVVIDHHNQEVRFLSGSYVAPEFEAPESEG